MVVLDLADHPLDGGGVPDVEVRTGQPFRPRPGLARRRCSPSGVDPQAVAAQGPHHRRPDALRRTGDQGQPRAVARRAGGPFGRVPIKAGGNTITDSRP